MVTSKKSHDIDKTDEYLLRLIKEYSNVVRFTYNRIREDINSQSELERIVKEKMNNISNMDASFIKCAVQKAKSVDASIKEIEKIDKKEIENIYWSIINRNYEDLSSYLSSTRWKKMVIENTTKSDNLIDLYKTINQTKWRHSYRLVFKPDGINCFKLNRSIDNHVIYYHFN